MLKKVLTVAACMVGVSCAAARGQPVISKVQPVFQSGDFVPGSATDVLVDLGVPHISASGTVICWAGSIVAGDMLLRRTANGMESVVIAAGAAAPGGGTFAEFGRYPAINSSGEIVFRARTTVGDGIFLHDGLSVTTIVMGGDPVPGAVSQFQANNQFCIATLDPRRVMWSDAGIVLFEAATNNASPEFGLFAWEQSTQSLHRVMVYGDETVPGDYVAYVFSYDINAAGEIVVCSMLSNDLNNPSQLPLRYSIWTGTLNNLTARLFGPRGLASTAVGDWSPITGPVMGTDNNTILMLDLIVSGPAVSNWITLLPAGSGGIQPIYAAGGSPAPGCFDVLGNPIAFARLNPMFPDFTYPAFGPGIGGETMVFRHGLQDVVGVNPGDTGLTGIWYAAPPNASSNAVLVAREDKPLPEGGGTFGSFENAGDQFAIDRSLLAVTSDAYPSGVGPVRGVFAFHVERQSQHRVAVGGDVLLDQSGFSRTILSVTSGLDYGKVPDSLGNGNGLVAGCMVPVLITTDDGQEVGIRTFLLADVNDDQSVSPQDLYDFLGFYFAQMPPGDFNGDGMYTQQDIFDFMGEYFAPTQCR